MMGFEGVKNNSHKKRNLKFPHYRTTVQTTTPTPKVK